MLAASFMGRYLRRVADRKSVLCVGLDPTIAHVPPALRTGKVVPDIETYLRQVIEIAADLVPVVKPQLAYYSALGTEGEEMLERITAFAQSKDLLVIGDGKRGDIGETMEQYGQEMFGRYNVDACTFIPYLGPTFDPSWMKWLEQGRTVISMIRTSNHEAGLLQDKKLEGGLLVYEYVAQLVAEWHASVAKKTAGMGGVGGVIGATVPEQAMKCSQIIGDDVFRLVPGYGAQGGGADGAVVGIVDGQREIKGAINSSRAITLQSWWNKDTKQPRAGDPLELVRAAIKSSNEDLGAALVRKFGITL